MADTDLEKLGLTLGHRRKLLRAIAARQPGPSGDRTRQIPSTESATHEAERRQVTVMFCDLVGSTELANAVDPEEMGALIRRFQETCADAINRFDGFVAKYMGDSVLAYFGYPRAHEDAVGQSVRAARAIIEKIAHTRRPDGRPLEVRAGIATGLVVIGDLVGVGVAREHAIVGETPNLAARLQAVADPGTILVSETTHQLLGRQFESHSRGEQTLKGFAKPVRVWQVGRETAVESRFAAIGSGGPSPLIGRIDEMEVLLQRWQATRQGNGQAILIQGEAGIGKSRIVDALSGRISDDPHVRVICQCSSYHSNTALYPIMRHLELAAGFAPEDTAACKLEKLEVLLAATDNNTAVTTSLMAELLSIPIDGRYAPLELPPAQRKAAIIAALIDQLIRLADRRPVLFVLEDAHWIDPTTQELMTRLLDGIGKTRILGVVTARPEYLPPKIGGQPMASCTLSRLSREQCADLAAGTTSGRALEPGLIDEIVAKADGIPLFIEELTKAVAESASSDRPVVPATLQDSLMARLDRLGPAKEIAQIAAVIGQQFPRSLLDTVAVERADEVETGLARLVDAGMLVAQSRANGPGYRFSHALMRDIAYENLLRSRRRQIHERIGRTLVDSFPETAEMEPEVVAHHFSNAQLPDLACTYHEHAGDRAAARSAFAEAAAHFRGSHAEAIKSADGEERTRRELALLLKLGPALTIIKGPQSAEVEETYRIAHEAGTKAGDRVGLFKATWGLWLSANHRRQLEIARDRAQELIALSGEVADPDLQLEAFHCRWSTALFRGEVPTALEYTQEGVRQYDSARHAWMGPVFGGHDPGVCANMVRGMVLCFSGQTVQARDFVNKGLSLADALGHPHTLGFALMNALATHQTLGDRDVVRRLGSRMAELAEKYNFPPMRAHALLVSAWARAAGADIGEGLAIMEAEYPRASAIGPLYRYYAAILADVREQAGRTDDALSLVQWALGTVTEPGVGMYVPELHRLHGVCLLNLGADDDGRRALQTALDVAKQQGTTLFQLKAALSMAKAALPRGWPRQSLDPLRAVCAELPANFDGPWLAEAKQVLAA
ncbi:MAG TPA: adenylate/guanylate cyclase domain-containing protein [Casimicrobiaceae bacterium]|nr:adenylate/guanylate cyclase domain-containing protein [Casimicrobiaceae bacterium]